MPDNEADVLELERAEADTAEAEIEDKPRDKKSARLQLSISFRSLMIATVIAILVVAVVVLAWFAIGVQHRLDAQLRQSGNNARAEKIAIDYAVNAAAMSYGDLNGWKTKLVAGTTPELKDKLSKAATSMEQLVVPLQWNSTARPLAAKVRSQNHGVYGVDAFVSVVTKTAQSPEGLESTATYSITIDSGNDWKISDVGGVGAMLNEH